MNIMDYVIRDIHKVSIVRNFFQFFIGLSLFIATGVPADYLLIAIASLGFLLAYQSAYSLNDIQDLKEDSQDPVKKATKPLARGDISVQEQSARMFLYLLLGLSMSFLVNIAFASLVVLCVFLNFLHSYRPLGLKYSLLGLVNLFFIESIKFSAGWFVLGGSLLDIPYFMVFFMSSAYTLSYFVYKKNIDLDSLRKKRSVLLFASAVVFYLVSLYSYKLYRLPLIGVSLVFLFPLLMMRTKDFYGKLKGGIVFVILIFVFFNLLLLLSPVEPFRSANMYLASLF
ncbi:MAG TPA: UbiA family prenyltransferase [archaeon]|nr:UbiA family prenyltransferase [archaeon]